MDECIAILRPSNSISVRKDDNKLLNATDLTIGHISVLPTVVVVVVLLFYVHGKHVRSCRDGQLT